jgi:hypothetical protein
MNTSNGFTRHSVLTLLKTLSTTCCPRSPHGPKGLRSYKLRKRRSSDLRANKFIAWKDAEVVARKEKAKREGTYRPGMSMADNDDNEELLRQPARKRNKSRSGLVCPQCKLKGHTTTRSRGCLHYNGNMNAPPHAAATVPSAPEDLSDADAAEDIDAFASVPIEPMDQCRTRGYL